MAVAQKFCDDYVDVPLNGVKVRWAKVHPHQWDSFQGGPKKHCIDVMISDEQAATFKKGGFLVKGEKGEYFLTPKAKGDKDAPDYRPLSIVGRDGRTPVTAEIGNGSTVNIILSARKWTSVAKISTYIGGIQVLDLVEYSGGTGFANVDEDADPEY